MIKTEIGDATFILGDCLDVMQDIAYKNVDLILTDPPYGIGEAANKNRSRGNLAIARDYGNDDWDSEIPSADIFKEIFRISKEQVIFGGNYFTEYLPPSPSWIVWDKDNGECDFADCELAWTSHKKAVRKIKYRWKGFLQEPGHKRNERFHPTQKPIFVMKWILKKYSLTSEIICDPFMGSGTTAIACYNAGRKFIGIEKEKKYFDIAVARYKRETAQLRIGDL
ncbi:MAG: site-specific DNA-methyltransferase [Calditrichia bacterium]